MCLSFVFLCLHGSTAFVVGLCLGEIKVQFSPNCPILLSSLRIIVYTYTTPLYKYTPFYLVYSAQFVGFWSSTQPRDVFFS